MGKGQIYILASIILCLVIFGLYAVPNKIFRVKVGDIFDVSGNYILESSELVNYAIYTKKDVNKLFDEFSEKFVDYLGNKDPDVGLLYVFSYGDEVDVVNWLKNLDVNVRNVGVFLRSCSDKVRGDVDVDGLGLSLESNVPYEVCREVVNRVDNVDLEIKGVEYRFNTKYRNPKIGVIFIKEEENNIVVYTNAVGKRVFK